VPGRVGTNQDLVSCVSSGAMGPGDRFAVRVEPGADDVNQIGDGVRACLAGPVLNIESFA
jgi:hypothetical protein